MGKKIHLEFAEKCHAAIEKMDKPASELRWCAGSAFESFIRQTYFGVASYFWFQRPYALFGIHIDYEAGNIAPNILELRSDDGDARVTLEIPKSKPFNFSEEYIK